MDNPNEILLALGRLEGKVDAMFKQQNRSLEHVDDLDVRIRALEHSRGLLLGSCAVLATLASYVVSYYKP